MNKILNLITQRKSSIHINIMTSINRGAKKKTEVNTVRTQHLFNIYKDKPDFIELPDDVYPQWIFELTKYNTHNDMISNSLIGTYVNII